MIYVALLAVTWLINGSTKFAVNWMARGREAFALVGYGGFPSTHTAMVSSVLWYTGLVHGFDQPAVGVALVLLWVVTTDARGLRGAVGQQAQRLNELAPEKPPLRTRMGHRP